MSQCIKEAFSLFKKRAIFFGLTLAFILAPLTKAAAEGEGGHGAVAVSFLWIAVVLLAAKISGLVEKFGQPAVLGELVMGVILGNLALLGLHFFEPIKQDTNVAFLAELGVVILLFQIGLESNIQKMKKVGLKAFMVAIVGVVLPFVLGTYMVGPWLLPGLTANAYLFLGAALTATSVGITARVFKDLGKLQTSEAQIVLGAAVIDDVMGLIILAVVTALATAGAVSLGMISWIIAKAILFLVGAIVIGQLLAKYSSKAFSKIHTGIGMKFTLAIVIGLAFAWLAGEIGLAPIVGAFAAGLVLDPVHFRSFKEPELVADIKETLKEAGNDIRNKISIVLSHHADRHVEDLIEPLSFFLVPIFFVLTGMNVNLSTLLDLQIILVALAITVAAFIGKYLCGFAFKGSFLSRSIVGMGMIPRGEVGLIFATIGRSLGVISETTFSVIVIMVILTTLIPPIVLTPMLKKLEATV